MINKDLSTCFDKKFINGSFPNNNLRASTLKFDALNYEYC